MKRTVRLSMKFVLLLSSGLKIITTVAEVPNFVLNACHLVNIQYF